MFRSNQRWAVYAVEDGRAQLRSIEIGHRGRLQIEVTGGLAPGATAILHPSDRISDGTSFAAR